MFVEWAAGFKPNQGKKAYGIGYEEEKAGTLLSGQVGGVLVKMSYQKTTGPLMANSHPGSYSGQDVYSDMLITERGGVKTWTFAMQRSDSYKETEVASTMSARQYKSETDLVVTTQPED